MPRHRTEDPELVGDVVKVALALATDLGRVLADQMENRDTVVVGGRHRSDGVERPGAVGGEGDAHPTRGSRVPIGHEDRGLLVTHLDVPQLGVIDEGVVHRERPDAGDPEQEVDPLGDERLDQDMTTASSRHQQDPLPVAVPNQTSG